MKGQQISSRKQTERKEAEKAAARMAGTARPLGGNSASSPRIDPMERRRLVAEAAYYHAERRGFAPGGELQDWLDAETEIGRLLDS
jgi:hypothetical protein